MMMMMINYEAVLLLTTNISKENIYCDLRGKVFNILNKFVHQP